MRRKTLMLVLGLSLAVASGDAARAAGGRSAQADQPRETLNSSRPAVAPGGAAAALSDKPGAPKQQPSERTVFSIPEPASLAVAGLALLAMRRRRRR